MCIDNEKTPSVWFESAHMNQETEYDIQDVYIGPIPMRIPIPRGGDFVIGEIGEGKARAYTLNIKIGGKAILTFFFHSDNIRKDKGDFFTKFRDYDYERYCEKLKENDILNFFRTSDMSCENSVKSTFESNSENGYMFWSGMICTIENGEYAINVGDGAFLINGFFSTYIALNYNKDEIKSKAILTSWLNRLLMENRAP